MFAEHYSSFAEDYSSFGGITVCASTFTNETRNGDEVMARIHSGVESNELALISMFVADYKEQGTTHIVRLIPTEIATDMNGEIENWEDVYTLQMAYDDPYVICPGTSVRMRICYDGELELIEIYHPMICRSLVNMGKRGSREDVMAKYEAYADPCVAALAETPGLITRNRAYPARHCPPKLSA